ncbi:hypothetical protein ACFYW8_15115 [Streptomyces sp. NPDC002742]|uniref:hypothetical protein n=1 Tax=Streptomyces sp. NPDC002742 TaxID=3364663 RepID=UPI0036B0E08F
MGNLGAYEAFSTAAKKAGGVDALLDLIKKAAFDKGASAGFAKGAAVGAVGGGLVVSGVVAVTTRVRSAQKAREVRAEEAEEQLKDLVRESTDLKDS